MWTETSDRLANEFSNEKELFFGSAENQTPGNPELDSVLAHEFQHMIHWARPQ